MGPLLSSLVLPAALPSADPAQRSEARQSAAPKRASVQPATDIYTLTAALADIDDETGDCAWLGTSSPGWSSISGASWSYRPKRGCEAADGSE